MRRGGWSAGAVGALAAPVAGRLAVALAVAGQAYDVGPDSLMVRLDDQGLVPAALREAIP